MTSRLLEFEEADVQTWHMYCVHRNEVCVLPVGPAPSPGLCVGGGRACRAG